MQSFTFCQINRTKVAVRTVSRDIAEPDMNLLLTSCQANRIIQSGSEGGTARPGIKSLTSCQANQSARGKGSEKGHSSAWHGVTHFLLSQQDQSGNEDSEKGHSWTCHGITHSLSNQ